MSEELMEKLVDDALAKVSALGTVGAMKWLLGEAIRQQKTSSNDAELWRALILETSASPCEWPCLRDYLADWMLDHKSAKR